VSKAAEMTEHAPRRYLRRCAIALLIFPIFMWLFNAAHLPIVIGYCVSESACAGLLLVVVSTLVDAAGIATVLYLLLRPQGRNTTLRLKIYFSIFLLLYAVDTCFIHRQIIANFFSLSSSAGTTNWLSVTWFLAAALPIILSFSLLHFGHGRETGDDEKLSPQQSG
jgi:hypothetical protein